MTWSPAETAADAFPALVNLDLSSNQLTGRLPPKWPAMLQGLNLTANGFNGSLPAEMANMTELVVLVLDLNPLTGDSDCVCGFLPRHMLVSIFIFHFGMTGDPVPILGPNAGAFNVFQSAFGPGHAL